MREHRYSDWIWHIEKKTKEKYPLCTIEWFYDIQNLQDRDKAMGRIEVKLDKLMEILCFYSKQIHIYIRIHRYKDWYIVRIFIEKKLSQELICKIRKQVEKDMNSIISIVYENQCTIIKVALYKNDFNEMT